MRGGSKGKKKRDEEDPGRKGKSATLQVLRQGFELECLKQKRLKKERYDKGGGKDTRDVRLATVGIDGEKKCAYCKGVDRQNCMLKCDNRACGNIYHAFCIPHAAREAVGEGIVCKK
mgnify:CR=1 FL=1